MVKAWACAQAIARAHAFASPFIRLWSARAIKTQHARTHACTHLHIAYGIYTERTCADRMHDKHTHTENERERNECATVRDYRRKYCTVLFDFTLAICSVCWALAKRKCFVYICCNGAHHISTIRNNSEKNKSTKWYSVCSRARAYATVGFVFVAIVVVMIMMVCFFVIFDLFIYFPYKLTMQNYTYYHSCTLSTSCHPWRAHIFSSTFSVLIVLWPLLMFISNFGYIDFLTAYVCVLWIDLFIFCLRCNNWSFGRWNLLALDKLQYVYFIHWMNTRTLHKLNYVVRLCSHSYTHTHTHVHVNGIN